MLSIQHARPQVQRQESKGITHINALLSYVVGYINIDVGIDIYIDVGIDIDAVHCNLYLSWAGLRVLDCSFSIQ